MHLALLLYIFGLCNNSVINVVVYWQINFYNRGYRNESCEDQLSWQCQSGDCGTLMQSEIIINEANSSVVAWCQSEGYMTRNVSTNLPFNLR